MGNYVNSFVTLEKVSNPLIYLLLSGLTPTWRPPEVLCILCTVTGDGSTTCCSCTRSLWLTRGPDTWQKWVWQLISLRWNAYASTGISTWACPCRYDITFNSLSPRACYSSSRCCSCQIYFSLTATCSTRLLERVAQEFFVHTFDRVLLRSYSWAKIVLRTLNLIISHLTSLVFHHNFLEFFVGVKYVSTHLEGRNCVARLVNIVIAHEPISALDWTCILFVWTSIISLTFLLLDLWDLMFSWLGGKQNFASTGLEFC